MRRLMMLFVFGFLMLASLPGAAQWQGSLPDGDYARTCRDISMNGTVLEARCQKADGGWRNTSIDSSRCTGPVANDDGHLRCPQSGDSGSWSRGLPAGDYTQTCHDIRTNGTVLEARCRRSDGGWRTTSIDYRRCRGPIANDDGNLRCPESGYRQSWSGIPPGDYAHTCQDIRSNGTVLEARCQKQDGGWRTNVFDYSGCQGDVVNDDGRLRCGDGSGGGTARPGGNAAIPSGSYSQSCDNIRAYGDRLNARCQTNDGGWNNTSLDHYDDCRGEIVNDDGRLVCRR